MCVKPTSTFFIPRVNCSRTLSSRFSVVEFKVSNDCATACTTLSSSDSNCDNSSHGVLPGLAELDGSLATSPVFDVMSGILPGRAEFLGASAISRSAYCNVSI